MFIQTYTGGRDFEAVKAEVFKSENISSLRAFPNRLEAAFRSGEYIITRLLILKQKGESQDSFDKRVYWTLRDLDALPIQDFQEKTIEPVNVTVGEPEEENVFDAEKILKEAMSSLEGFLSPDAPFKGDRPIYGASGLTGWLDGLIRAFYGDALDKRSPNEGKESRSA